MPKKPASGVLALKASST